MGMNDSIEIPNFLSSIAPCSCGNNNRISGSTNHILPQSLTSWDGYSLV